MSDIRVTNLLKRFNDIVALDDVTFAFPESQVTCLLGPSGCGKTTLMRIIAGLEKPTGGEVFFGDVRVTGLPPRKRNIGMVFQYPVVYRGISVYQNIELPLKSEKLSKAERTQRVEEVIQLLGLGDAANKDITQLDNGTRQKVAVARAVARQPRIILFDEPITNVDTEAKLQLKRAFKELTRRLQQTIIYVTHDQTEAMTLADQIALMQDGRIVQCDTPRTLYDAPNDRFGGWFLGNPGMTFFDLTPRAGATGTTVEAPLFATAPSLAGVDVASLPSGLTAGIRPEHIGVEAGGGGAGVEAELLHRSITIGRQHLLTIRAGDLTFKAKAAPEAGDRLPRGGTVRVTVPLDRVAIFGPDGRRLDVTLRAPA